MTINYKPWTFVMVSTPDKQVEGYRRRFIGELVSFPTPDGSIMVRTIPGIAATAIEVPLDWIGERIPRKRVYLRFAEVSGLGTFPSDMLRYDMAVPANFTITADGDAVLEEGYEKLVVVTAAQYKHMDAFTPARWASFGWKCKVTQIKTVDAGDTNG